MLDQLLGPGNPGTDLVGFEVDEIQVITFLAPCKEIVVHLSQLPGTLPVVRRLHYNITPSLSTF